MFGCASIPAVAPGSRHPVVEVPVAIRSGFVMVQVHLDGVERELTFVIDSGAPTVLDASIAEELGVARPADRSLTDAAGGDVPVASLVLEGVRVGDLYMPRVSAFAAELPPFPSLCTRIDGFLGVGADDGTGFLDRTAIEIDYAAEKIVLAPSGDDLSPGGTVVRVRRRDLPPDPTVVYTSTFAEVEIEGRHRWVILDTGNAGAVDLSPGFFTALGRSFDEPGLVTRRGALSQTATGVNSGMAYETRLDSLRLGDLDLHGVPIRVDRVDQAIVAPDAHGMVLLGYELLRNFRVVLDLEGGFARFIAVPGTDPAAVDPDFGFSWLDVDGKVVVTTLVTGGPAERAGMELHDEIVAIDGTALRHDDPAGQCAARRAIADVARPLSIRVRRDDVERDVSLRAESLLPMHRG